MQSAAPSLLDCIHSFPPSLAMAPKKAFGPKTGSSRRVPLNDISTAEDSSWREVDDDRVKELVEMIKD